MTVDDEQGVYHVQGTFTAPVSSALAWAVLTDYDHIGEYVKSVKASAVERRGDGWLVLRQDARAGFFPLQRTVHVLLDVREQPVRQIRFVDRLGRDFRSYRGEWNLGVTYEGITVVTYSLEARPVAAMPHAIGRAWMGRAGRELLEQVRDEMIRRDRVAAEPHESGGRALAHPAASAAETP